MAGKQKNLYMIYKNGVEWTGWKDALGKTFRLKKSVKFYLTSHYQGINIVDDKKMVTYPESYALPPAYATMMEGAGVEIRYVSKPMATRGRGKNSGESQMTYSPSELVIRNGVFEVKKDQLDLYWWFTNHPRCETNPAYFVSDKEGKKKVNDDAVTLANQTYSHFIFRERNEELENEVSFDKEKAVIMAKHYIVNELTQKEAREIYKMFNEPDWEEASLARIKNYLLAKAGEDPKKFMEELDSEVRTYKSKVNEAVAAEIIFFDKLKKVWKFAGVGNNEKIMAVAKGDDPIITLAKHLQLKDSGELFESICAKVKEAEELAV